MSITVQVMEQENCEMFKFYQLFFDFQWNIGILPYKLDRSSQRLVYVVDRFFQSRNLLCNCLFPYILLQNVLLTALNLATDLELEPIEHSLILQASWILIFVLITSVLFIFEWNAQVFMETVTAWIHLEYFIQRFGFREAEKCRSRGKRFILVFKMFVLNISVGSLGLVLLYWFDPRFPVFLYAFFQLQRLNLSFMCHYVLKTMFLVFECSFLLFINGIYVLGFLLLAVMSMSVSACLGKLGRVAKWGQGRRTAEVILVYKRLEDLTTRLNFCFRYLILLEEVTALVATSVYVYVAIKHRTSVLQLTFFLIVLIFFLGITCLLYFPAAHFRRRSEELLTQLQSLTPDAESRRLLHTCSPLRLNPFRLHSIRYTTAPLFLGLVTNYVLLLLCM